MTAVLPGGTGFQPVIGQGQDAPATIRAAALAVFFYWYNSSL